MNEEAIIVRQTQPQDDASITELSKIVYPASVPWAARQLASHREVFPEGQFVAVTRVSQRVVGMAASLIILWDDYSADLDWGRFTNLGMFTNHDPEHGRTLYAAEVMVHPDFRGRGVGKQLYAARRELATRLRLLRIRAGARLRGYHRVASTMSAEEYVERIVRGELSDPTLSFQIGQGFEVLGVVSGYLKSDPESLGYAAIIEWLNPEVATPEDSAGRDPRFTKR